MNDITRSRNLFHKLRNVMGNQVTILRRNLYHRIMWFVVLSLMINVRAVAQVVIIDNSPRQFSVEPPKSWVRQPPTSGNSRVKFSAPLGTPAAECAVIVKEFPSLASLAQLDLDLMMAQPVDSDEAASSLATLFNNVQIVSTGRTSVSGHPAQLVNSLYSVGTSAGEQWSRGFSVTAATTPGIVWTITCGALGDTADDSQRGYSFWQLDMILFITNLKILR